MESYVVTSGCQVFRVVEHVLVLFQGSGKE